GAADGSIFVYGTRQRKDFTEPLIVKFDSTGHLDPTFGDDGAAGIRLSGQYYPGDMEIDSQGRLVLAGTRSRFGNFDDDRRDTDIALFRVSADGRLDKSFGTNCLTIVELQNGDSDTYEG